MRIRLALALLLLPATAGADIGDYPIREAERPLVLRPGLAEFDASASWAQIPSDYDADARVVPLAPGRVRAAALASVTGRYGLFRDFEIHVRAPWTLALEEKGSTQTLSGSGRTSLGFSWTPPDTGTNADLALGASLVFPTTARTLRTDPAGIVHRDHLAIGASLAGKLRIAEDSAAHAGGSVVFPFANADDRANDRTPPLSFSVDAGSTFQLSDRIWLDAAAGFARTNRDRIAGGIVPRSDQFLVDVRPSIGIAPTRWYDVAIAASIPVAGKNTAQAFTVGITGRARF